MKSYLSLLILITTAVSASCPTDTPATCAIDEQLANGRWDMSQVNGQYTINGNEVFCEFLSDGFCDLADDYDPVNGQLSVSRLGGEPANYLEVACDGSITGKGHEMINGTIDKTANIQYDWISCNDTDPQDMSWNIIIERQYDITGQVTGTGSAELTYTNDISTISIDGVFAYGVDCFWFSYPGSLLNFDVSGNPETVTLSGSYDPSSHTWNPTSTVIGGTSWVDDILHRLALNESTPDDPVLQPQGHSQPVDQLYNTYALQNTVEVTEQVSHEASPLSPKITAFTLNEPAQYLAGVPVDTGVTLNIDWRGQPPGQVEFIYAGQTETVAGSAVTHWTFDAGQPGQTIQAVAIQGNHRSVPYTLATPKVSLAPWAGSPGDWTGSSGVQYQGNLNWPVSMETSRSLGALSLFTGQWGLTGASSQYNTTIYSDGSNGSGDLSTQLTFQFAGQSVDFTVQGQNTSQLSCEDMSTDGDASIEIPIPGWQKTLNPITAIPGLQSAACSLSGFLCDVIQSIGIKASANANVSGTGLYAGDSGEMQWTGGTVGGSISAQAGAGILLPKPLHQAAGVQVTGGGSGCIDFQVAPDFSLSQLGAEMEFSANAFFLGLSASADHTWPIGDGCTGQPASITQMGIDGWVPLDGHLAMAQYRDDLFMHGVAVWSELSAGQSRPAGQLKLRFFDGSTQRWGPIQELTQAALVNHSPTIQFDELGRLLIVFQSNQEPIPVSVTDLSAFADGYELHWLLLDPVSSNLLNQGQLTFNNQHDFGPQLVTDADQTLSIFWQQAEGIEITGTPALPVSIRQLNWHASTDSWGVETVVADNLSQTYGWSVASHSLDQQFMVLTHDTDGQYNTSEDRELSFYQQTNGLWTLTTVITDNNLSDDMSFSAFDLLGNQLLFWRQQSQLLYSLNSAIPVTIELQQEAYMDGIGNGLAQAQLAQDGELKVLLWPQNTDLMLTTQNATGIWDAARSLKPLNDRAEQLFTTELHSGVLYYGAASRPLNGQGNSNLLLPAFSNTLIFDDIFEHGFNE
ncbi:hypothetical protein ACFODZ_07160 [Marinicella sediminis]|uniref:Uncharacterized protein n=1 Tax=Marinicella sediminis TaxID=1792834 RepID=A0ABV7J7A1_9GAMM|nr:hypothetical protein [Marinicella sediminis]